MDGWIYMSLTSDTLCITGCNTTMIMGWMMAQHSWFDGTVVKIHIVLGVLSRS